MKREFTDAEIVSFLDGESSSELTAAIALAIETDKNLQHRMAELDLDKETLQKSFDLLLSEAPKPDIRSTADTNTDPHIQQSRINAANDNKPTQKPFMRIAAILLAGVIGYSASFLAPAQAPKKPGWIQMVANYQQLFGQDTLAHITPDPENLREQLTHLSSRLGRDIDFKIATSRSDLNLKQTQLLEFNGKPLVQLAYKTASGHSLALCIIKSKKAGDAAPKYGERNNMQTALWRKGGYAYLLIGGQDKELIKNISQDLSAKL